jgi:hypothetical protein
VAVLAGTFLLGYWPQRSRAVAAEIEVARLAGALAAAQEENRLGTILGHSLRLSDAIDARNFGDAATMSSAFFDAVQAEASRTTRPDAKQALAQILLTRDQVTSTIARTDPAVSETLRQHELALRRALAYPVP